VFRKLSLIAGVPCVTIETLDGRRLVRTSVFQQLRADILSCAL